VTQKRDIITGLDVGTTKICALVAEREENGDIRILGVGLIHRGVYGKER